MVAYTSTQLLPYQVGSDPPCDFDDVWCDFVELLETNFAATDLILGRVSPTRPVARVLRSTSLAVSGSFVVPLPWEAVDFDTDNSVNLAENAFIVPVNRTGTYFVTGEAKVTGGTPADNMAIYLTSGFVDPAGSSASILATDFFRIPGAGSNYFLRTAAYGVNRPAFLSQVRLGMAFAQSTGTTSLTVLRASMSIYWVSDRFLNLAGN